MKKEFVPYQQSLQLKELGFDEKCFMYYWIHNKELAATQWYAKHSDDAIKISAPLYQQAFRFFSEKYGLFISFTRYKNSVVIEMPDTFSKVYEVWIQDENEDESIWVGGFGEHGEAELACLIKLIEIVKNK